MAPATPRTPVSLLSRIGIGDGGATVDLVVPETVRAGSTVDARVDVSGGSSDRDVETAYAALRTEYDTAGDPRPATVAEYTLVDGLTVEAGEERSFDVDLAVPAATPVTGSADVWIDTGLDIAWATDPADTDPVDVTPGPRLSPLLDAVEDLGFARRFSEALPAAETPLADATERPFVQGFVFEAVGTTPAATAFDDYLGVVVHPGADGLVADLSHDRPDDPFAGAGDDGADVEVGPDADAAAVRERVRAAVESLA
jgi:sporulation-control protein